MKFSPSWQIFIFFFLILSLLTSNTILSANDASRIATIQSIVDYHSLAIDNSLFVSTIDKYFYQGHFYSDKPALLAIYSSFFYFLLKQIGINFNDNYHLTYYLITLLVVGGFTSLGLVYLYKTIRLLTISTNYYILLLVTFSSTLIVTYSTIFNNHTVSASLLIIGFYYLLLFKTNSSAPFLSGLSLALAGSVDFTVFFFLPFSVIPIFDKPLKDKLKFTAACLLVISIYLFLNFHTSGSFLPASMNKNLWNYPGSLFNESNLSGVTYHPNLSSLLTYTFHMILGYRGLISYSPILLFSLLGFSKVLFKPSFPYRREYLFIIFGSLTYIFMYIFKSNNYSGWSFGVRWYADLMFLLCLPLAHIIDDIKAVTKSKIVFLSTFFISSFISFVGIIHPYTPINNNEPIPFFTCLKIFSQYLTNFSSLSWDFLRAWFILIIFLLFCFLLFKLIISSNKKPNYPQLLVEERRKEEINNFSNLPPL